MMVGLTYLAYFITIILLLLVLDLFCSFSQNSCESDMSSDGSETLLTRMACGSMENTYKQLGAIFVKTLELAKGGPV